VNTRATGKTVFSWIIVFKKIKRTIPVEKLSACAIVGLLKIVFAPDNVVGIIQKVFLIYFVYGGGNKIMLVSFLWVQDKYFFLYMQMLLKKCCFCS